MSILLIFSKNQLLAAFIFSIVFLFSFTYLHSERAQLLQSCLTLWTLWTIAHQAPLSMGFSRKEYWSELPCSPPGDLPNPGVKPASLMSSALVGRFFTTGAICVNCWFIVLLSWRGFPDGSDGKESTCNAAFIHRLGKSLGGGNGNPTPVFLPEKSHAQRSFP